MPSLPSLPAELRLTDARTQAPLALKTRLETQWFSARGHFQRVACSDTRHEGDDATCSTHHVLLNRPVCTTCCWRFEEYELETIANAIDLFAIPRALAGRFPSIRVREYAHFGSRSPPVGVALTATVHSTCISIHGSLEAAAESPARVRRVKKGHGDLRRSATRPDNALMAMNRVNDKYFWGFWDVEPFSEEELGGPGKAFAIQVGITRLSLIVGGSSHQRRRFRERTVEVHDENKRRKAVGDPLLERYTPRNNRQVRTCGRCGEAKPRGDFASERAFRANNTPICELCSTCSCCGVKTKPVGGYEVEKFLVCEACDGSIKCSTCGEWHPASSYLPKSRATPVSVCSACRNVHLCTECNEVRPKEDYEEWVWKVRQKGGARCTTCRSKTHWCATCIKPRPKESFPKVQWANRATREITCLECKTTHHCSGRCNAKTLPKSAFSSNAWKKRLTKDVKCLTCTSKP